MKVGAVVLAAGCSSRFGPENKLLADVDGRAMIAVVTEKVARVVGADNVLAVTGFEREAVEDALARLALRSVYNPSWADGMGSSIAAGIANLNADLDGVFVVPGDMPLMTEPLLRGLIAEFGASGGNAIVFPTTKSGEQRNPVLWPRRYFAELVALGGQEGGKGILRSHPEHWRPIRASDDRELLDIDVPGSLPRESGE